MSAPHTCFAKDSYWQRDMHRFFLDIISSWEFQSEARKTGPNSDARSVRREMIAVLNKQAAKSGISPDSEDLILQARFIDGELEPGAGVQEPQQFSGRTGGK